MKVNLKSHRHSNRGFLHDYLIYTEKQESPEAFHLWTGMGILSAALGRNIWYDHGYFNLYPNIWPVLVAESGMLSKSTALLMGVNMLKDSCPEVAFFSDKCTTEALIGYLAQRTKDTGRAVAVIYASEFVVFFGDKHMDQSLIHLLTTLYDCPTKPWVYQTRMRGEEILEQVGISMLAGTTPEWLKSCLPDEAVGGGFASRLILVPRYESERSVPRPKVYMNDPDILRARDACIADLRTIACLHGECKMSLDAENAYDKWYLEFKNREIADVHPNLRGYFSRKRDYIIKIAMISSASRNQSLIMDLPDILFAIKVLEENERYMKQVAQTMGSSEEGKNTRRVSDYIQRKSPVDLVSVSNNFSHVLNSNQLAITLKTLQDSGQIKQEVVTDKSKKGRVVVVWVGDKRAS